MAEVRCRRTPESRTRGAITHAIKFLEQTEQRWVDAGAPLTALTEIREVIAELKVAHLHVSRR